MVDPASLISALAASLAAGLAGINLYVSGRRERTKWIREASVEVFLAFLGCSFGTSRACRLLVEARLAGADPAELQVLIEHIDELHREQTTALTRIRLLAEGRAVVAAQRLHAADHAHVDLAMRAGQPLTNDQLRSLWVARDDFVLAAKRAMGIPAPISAPTLESAQH